MEKREKRIRRKMDRVEKKETRKYWEKIGDGWLPLFPVFFRWDQLWPSVPGLWGGHDSSGSKARFGLRWVSEAYWTIAAAGLVPSGLGRWYTWLSPLRLLNSSLPMSAAHQVRRIPRLFLVSYSSVQWSFHSAVAIPKGKLWMMIAFEWEMIFLKCVL